MTPLVSVIIPTYQRVAKLERAIRSIAQQNYPNVEIIVVDDHSSDSTFELVHRLQDEDPRIQYIRMESNVGPAGARNAGVAKSKGDYIAFLDSDDEWLPEKLRLQVDVLEEFPDAGIVFTDCRMINTKTGSIQKLSSINNKFLFDLELREIPGRVNFFQLHGPIQESLFRKFFIVISSVVMRKEYYQLINGFDNRRFGTEDIDFFVRLAPHCGFIYWNLEKVQKQNDETGVSNVNERWLLENIRYYEDCLSSKEYSDLLPLTKWNLKRFYKSLLILYGVEWQPKKSCLLFITSLRHFVSPMLAFFTLLSFLGPFPLTFYNFLKENFNR